MRESAAVPKAGPPRHGHENEAAQEDAQAKGSLGGGVSVKPRGDGAQASEGGFHVEPRGDGAIAGHCGEAQGRANEDGPFPAGDERAQAGDGLDGGSQDDNLPRGQPWKQAMRRVERGPCHAEGQELEASGGQQDDADGAGEGEGGSGDEAGGGGAPVAVLRTQARARGKRETVEWMNEIGALGMKVAPLGLAGLCHVGFLGLS